MTDTPPPTAPGANPRVVLYMRRECCLCDDARLVLQQHGLVPQCVDVDDNPELREQFGNWVPVVEIDGQIRFRGRVEPVLLRRLLARSTGR